MLFSFLFFSVINFHGKPSTDNFTESLRALFKLILDLIMRCKICKIIKV